MHTESMDKTTSSARQSINRLVAARPGLDSRVSARAVSGGSETRHNSGRAAPNRVALAKAMQRIL